MLLRNSKRLQHTEQGTFTDASAHTSHEYLIEVRKPPDDPAPTLWRTVAQA